MSTINLKSVAFVVAAAGAMFGGAMPHVVAQDSSAEPIVQQEINTPMLPIGMMQNICSGVNCYNDAHWDNPGPVNQVHFASALDHEFNLDDPRYASFFAENGEVAYTIMMNGEVIDAGETSLEKPDVIVAKDVLFTLDNGVDNGPSLPGAEAILLEASPMTISGNGVIDPLVAEEAPTNFVSMLMWRVNSTGGEFKILGPAMNQVLFEGDDCNNTVDLIEEFPFPVSYTYSDGASLHFGNTSNPDDARGLQYVCWIVMAEEPIY